MPQEIAPEIASKTAPEKAPEGVFKVKITLNGEERLIKPKTSIEKLILELELDMKKIAIEKNYEIILPENFQKNILNEGDQIEIVHFIGGG
ncbi:MAG: thiamine biosynthesis protein ThiS [Rickettsiales bacterium]|jgi:thiamine biosynthesis protein ThiS